MEKEEKLEVPVEFDEGISKLLAKIEQKRKTKIEEHKKLLLKMEREKEEEEKRKIVREKENAILDELDKKVQEENERKLNEATANIIERQKRFEHEKETEKAVKDKTNPAEIKTINKVKTGSPTIIYLFFDQPMLIS